MLTLLAQAVAADPWKWSGFHATLRGLPYETPWFAVLLTGMAAAVAYRRRYPTVSRRVLIGCAGLLVVRLAMAFHVWAWMVIDPDPMGRTRPLHRWPIWGHWDAVGLGCNVLFMLGQAGFLWVLVTAVVHGRSSRSEGEGI